MNLKKGKRAIKVMKTNMLGKWLISLSVITTPLVAMEKRTIEEQKSLANVFEYMLQERNHYSWTSELVKDYLIPSKQEFNFWDITAVSYSPDGTKLAVAAEKAYILYSTQQNKTLRVGHPLQPTIGNVVWSADGNYLLLGIYEDAINLYDVPNQENKIRLPLYSRLLSAGFSPNGDLAVGMADGTVSIREVPSLNQISLFKDGNWVTAVAYSKNYLATATDDNAIHVRDAASLQHLRKLSYKKWVRTLRFSPDEQALIAGSSEDDHISLIDTQSWQEKKKIPVTKRKIYPLAFCPNRSLLLVGTGKKKVSIIRTSDWETIGSIPFDYPINSISCSADKIAFAGGEDARMNTLTVYDATILDDPWLADSDNKADEIATFRQYMYAKIAAREKALADQTNNNNNNNND